MAKILPGPMASAISGSIRGTVFSRNRGGAYIRGRTIPSTVTSPAALNIKGILAARSQAWAGLSSAERNAWTEYARQTPITDTLGQTITRSGHQAYVALNSRLELIGQPTIDVPPIVNAPDALSTYTQTYDIGAGSFAAAFTPTPLAANERLWIQAAVVNSAGKSYVRNLYRFVGTSAAAQATGFDAESLVEARWGALTVGQTVHFLLSVVDEDTGLLSPPKASFGAVVST